MDELVDAYFDLLVLTFEEGYDKKAFRSNVDAFAKRYGRLSVEQQGEVSEKISKKLLTRN